LYWITIISISTHCPGLQLSDLRGCFQITDASIISISTHCTGLQSLHLDGCDQITDASIISISTHCTGLQSLHLENCKKISDASIISISEKCIGLKKLDVSYTRITDASLIAIAKNCTGLQYLCASRCDGLSSNKLRNEFKSVSELRAALLSIYPFLPIWIVYQAVQFTEYHSKNNINNDDAHYLIIYLFIYKGSSDLTFYNMISQYQYIYHRWYRHF